MPEVTLCRLCGTLAAGMFSTDDDEQLQYLVNEFSPTKIAQIDGLPNTVCQRCYEHLACHAEFLENCHATARDYEIRMIKGGARISRISWDDFASQGVFISKSSIFQASIRSSNSQPGRASQGGQDGHRKSEGRK